MLMYVRLYLKTSLFRACAQERHEWGKESIFLTRGYVQRYLFDYVVSTE